jgi:archaellum component FlaC
LKATLDAEQARVDRARAVREPYDKKFKDAVAVTDSFSDEINKLNDEANGIEEQLGTA